MTDNPTTPATPASINSARAPHRVRGRLTSLVTIAVAASVVSALGSVVTATIAVSSYVESQRLRAQLLETSKLADPPRVTAPDVNEGEALPPIEVHIMRARIDDMFTNTNELASQARIVPAFQDGKAVGFKLFSIRPASVYGELGFENGDVVRRINGFDMTSPDKSSSERALEIYSKLREAKDFTIDVIRRGHPLQIHITVVD